MRGRGAYQNDSIEAFLRTGGAIANIVTPPPFGPRA
jgi:hypothetical protein